jgi:multicomponent Na+:H+ antiporter subunit D
MGSRARFYFGGAPRGVFAQAWPIGTTAIWIAVLLTAYVIFYYIV